MMMSYRVPVTVQRRLMPSAVPSPVKFPVQPMAHGLRSDVVAWWVATKKDRAGMSSSFVAAFAIRYLLVILFFPFSALDKILDFRGAVAQAKQQVPVESAAKLLIVAGLAVEIFMPLGILSGIADRLAAFILAGYCGVTALLWKQFWRPGDFWRVGESNGRALFWDFLKNFSLAGGFLLITFGTTAATIGDFVSHPLASSHPYSTDKVLAKP
jgi:putative oxidoreductase